MRNRQLFSGLLFFSIFFLVFAPLFLKTANAQNGLPPSPVISAMAWNSEGTLLATGHFSGMVRIWDAATREVIFEFEGGGSEGITSVTWQPGGSLLAAGNYDGSIRIWDTETGELFDTLLPNQGWISGLVWTLDGSSLVFIMGETPNFHLWNLDTDQLSDRGNTRGAAQMAWRSDGTLLATANPTGVEIMDAATLQPVVGFQNPEPVGRGGDVYSVAWHPGGKLVAGGSLNGSVRLWDIETGEMVDEFRGNYYPIMGGFETSVFGLHFSADGTQLTSVSADGTIRTWEVETGRVLADVQAEERISAAAWSEDGCWLAYGINTANRAKPDEDRDLFSLMSFCAS